MRGRFARRLHHRSSLMSVYDSCIFRPLLALLKPPLGFLNLLDFLDALSLPVEAITI
jgi:hypothetical protein